MFTSCNVFGPCDEKQKPEHFVTTRMVKENAAGEKMLDKVTKKIGVRQVTNASKVTRNSGDHQQ